MTHAYGVEKTVGRSTRLDRVLAELVAQVPEIEAASVVSFDGLPMAAALPPGMDEDRVAAMSAALLSLGERAAEGLGRGELSQVYVEGENGTVFLISADDEGVLVAVAAKGAKVGLMLFEVRRAAEAVAAVLRVEPLLSAVEDIDEIDEAVEAVEAVPAVQVVEDEPAVHAVTSAAPVAPPAPVPPAVVRALEDPPTFFAPAYDDAVEYARAEHDVAARTEPAYVEPAYIEPAYVEPAPVPVLQAAPEPAYKPVVEAFGPLVPQLRTVAAPSPASSSWYAAETILPGAGTGATDPSNWG